MGKNWFEDAILEEISELITVIKSHAGKPFGPAVNVQLGVSNVICALIFGKRFEHSDAQYQKLLRILSESMHLLPALTLLQYFPMLRYIPFGKLHNALKEFYVNDRTQSEFIQSLVNEKGRGTSTDESAAAADYITRFDSEKRKKAVANLSSFTGTPATVPKVCAASVFAATHGQVICRHQLAGGVAQFSNSLEISTTVLKLQTKAG